MPIYEYECPHCNDTKGKALRFDVRQADYDKHLVRCPKCKAVAHRLMTVCNSTFGFRFTEASHERFGPKEECERDV